MYQSLKDKLFTAGTVTGMATVVALVVVTLLLPAAVAFAWFNDMITFETAVVSLLALAPYYNGGGD